MTQALSALLPAATVGTQRQAPATPALGGDAGALLAQAAAGSDDAATRLLRMAGVLTVCSRAGARGIDAMPPPLPCASQTHAAPDQPSINTALAWALRDGPQRLQHEALMQLAAQGWRLPAALLPAALEQGRRAIVLRPAVMAALGERGRWLAAHNAAWHWAASTVGDAQGSDGAWTDGRLEQRRAWLRTALAREPQSARERLVQALPELPANERAELLAELRDALSADDESLLDASLQDRSKEVRQVAQSLLLRLPRSGFVRRATQRIEPWLRQERALLKKRWTIEPPQAAPEEWKTQGIDTTRPKGEALGERAWWLYQCVRQTPLPWWSDHLGLTPPQLLDWAASTDWAAALTRGWFDVLQAAPQEAWCNAFLDQWPKTGPREDPAAVLALLPLAARERWWERQLRGLWRSRSLTEVLPQIMAACAPGTRLTRGLSQLLAERAANDLPANMNDWTLRSLTPELVCLLDIASLGPLQQVAAPPDATPSQLQSIQLLQQVVQTRLALHTLPDSPTRSSHR
jgi:hypothetical protein